jgi:hypothetical protein
MPVDPDYVYGTGTVPGTKTNFQTKTSVPPGQKVTNVEVNQLTAAHASTKAAITAGRFHGLADSGEPTTDPNAARRFRAGSVIKTKWPSGVVSELEDETGARWNDTHQGAVNARKFGAKGDGATDDTDAIQAAIDAGTNVFLPKGTYIQSKPLFINKALKLEGSGMNETFIQTTNPYTGPNIVVAPDHSAGPNLHKLVYTAALVGSGNAIRQNYSVSHALLDLFQVPQVRIGRKADGSQQPWTISFYCKVDSGALIPSFANMLLWAGGAVDASMSTGTQSFAIGVDDFGGSMKPKVYFRCGGFTNNYYIQTATHTTFADNTVHHFEISWDGTHLRCFWNGELWTPGAFTPSNPDGTGFTQFPWEQFNIGAGQPFYLGLDEASWAYVASTLDVLHISNVVRHTATFTPANAKETEDGNTLLLLNFDRTWKHLLIGRTLAFGPGDVYLLPECGQSGETPFVRLGDFGLIGGSGIKMDFASQSELHDINHQGCTDGWKLTNNGYFSKLHKLRIYSGTFLGTAFGGRYGLQINGGSYIGMDDLHTSAPLCYVFNQANLFGKTINYTVEPNVFYGLMLLGGGGTYTFAGASADYEGGGGSLRSLLHIEAPQAATFSGSTFATSVGPHGQSPVSIVQNGDPASFDYAVTFDTCTFQTPDNTTPIIKAGGLQPFFRPVEVRNPYNPIKAPLCDRPGVVVQVGSLQREGVINAADYGFDLTGATDNTANMVKMIADAQAKVTSGQGVTLYFPKGKYKTVRPARITSSRMHVVGDGPNDTIFTDGGSALGPAFFASPSMAGVIPANGVALNPTADYYSLNFTDSSLLRYLLPSELPFSMWSVNGKSAMGYRCWYKPTTAADATLGISVGKRTSNGSSSIAWQLSVDSGGHAFARVTTTSGGLHTITGSTVLSAGTTYHLEMNYDGANLKLFVNGVQDATAAVTGTIVQQWYEETYLGVFAVQYAGSNAQGFGPRGYIHMAQLAQAAFHTSGFTVPNFHGTDGNTLFTVQNFTGATVDGCEVFTDSSNRAHWLPYWEASVGSNIEDVRFDDIGFDGHNEAIRTRLAVGTKVRNVKATCASIGVQFTNNSFYSRLQDADIYLGASAYGNVGRIGAFAGFASGLAAFTNVKVQGGRVGVGALGSGITLHNTNVSAETDNATGYYFLQGFGSTATVDGSQVTFSNESGAGINDAAVILDGSQTTTIKGLVTSQFGDFPALIADVGGVSGGPNVTLDSPYWGRSGTPSGPLTKAIGTFAKGRIRVANPRKESTDTGAWCDTSNVVTVELDGSKTNATGISATDTPAKNLRGTATIASGTDHIAVTFVTAESDTSYFVPGWIAKNKTTAGFDLYNPGGNVGADTPVDWMLVR